MTDKSLTDAVKHAIRARLNQGEKSKRFAESAREGAAQAMDGIKDSAAWSADKARQGVAAVVSVTRSHGAPVITGVTAGVLVVSEKVRTTASFQKMLEVMRDPMPFWDAYGQLSRFSLNLDWANVEPTKYLYAGTRGASRGLPEAQKVWEAIPESIRAAGPESTAKYLEGKDWSHIHPHSEGGSQLASNGLFEDASLNRARGSDHMAPRELEAAQRVLRSNAFHATLLETAKCAMEGALTASVVRAPSGPFQMYYQPGRTLKVRLRASCPRSPSWIRLTNLHPINDFITHVRYGDLPNEVRKLLSKNLLDLFAATIAGTATPAANIMADYAATAFPGDEATIAGRGRIGSGPGAALANACAANALDVDDGFRGAKGHPGAVIIPAALAMAQAENASGADFLAAVAIGYEVGMRAGTIWHCHPQRGPSYHGSGSWGSLGAAAACARLLKLGPQEVEHALAIAEYHAPLAPIMICVRHPAMVKDGIHWGAFVGVTAAQLAARGFTGTSATPYADEYRGSMQTLGTDWWIERVYYKFYPCCRWAQPAIAGALELRTRHDLTPDNIASVRIETFEAATHLGTRRPANTEEAQYSLPYPVACAFVHGRVGVPEIAGRGMNDEEVLALSDRVEMSVDPDIEARFPGEALARVIVTTSGGRTHSIGPLPAPGDPDSGVTLNDLVSKAHRLIDQVTDGCRAEHLVETVLRCADLRTIEPLAECLARCGSGGGSTSGK